MNIQIDTTYLQDTLTRLLNTPSPVGDTGRGIELCREMVCAFEGVDVRTTIKGALVTTIPGQRDDAPRAVTAHVDTLGAVVRYIKPSGKVALAKLGNFAWNTLENEGVTVLTQDGAEYRGTVMIENASHHIHSGGSAQLQSRERNESTMEVRLDARTASADETRALGIEVGDIVCVDPRPEWNHGFIRSRHLDDKACLVAMLAALKWLRDNDRTPAQRSTLHIANYEEVGHGGASGFPKDIVEVLALDIAPLGDEQNSDEFHCSMCVRDADGPYDISLRRRLTRLAKNHGIAFKPDTYREYCSDGDALWKAGADVRAALIGPGVDATHGYERTHLDAIVATAQMVVAYLIDDEV